MTTGATPRGGLVALLLLLFVSLAMSSSGPTLPRDAPTIVLSVDRTLWHRMGLSRWTYERALRRAGARVRRLDHSSLGGEEDPAAAAERLLAGAAGLVLSGGGDVDPTLYGADRETGLDVKPERDRFELALLAAARRQGLPLLAICRGAQLLNVARGGTLRTLRGDPGLRSFHRRLRGHAVEVEADSVLARVFETDRLPRVVSWHGQAVDRPGEGLRVTARAVDGVVEAVEPAAGGEGGQWLLAVQWHPELSPQSRLQRRLFTALVAAARDRR